MIFFTNSKTASLKKLLQQPQSTVYRQYMISVFSSSKRRLKSRWQLRAINKGRKYDYLLVRSRMGNKVRQTATWTAGWYQSIRKAKYATRRSVILVKLLNLQKSLKTDLSEDFYYCSRYLLTPWCRILLEKLPGLQLVKKFPAFHGTRSFITALTSFRHLSLSCASPIQSIYPHPTSWRSILILSTHLRLGLPSDHLSRDFPTKTLYTPLSSPIRASRYRSKIEYIYVRITNNRYNPKITLLAMYPATTIINFNNSKFYFYLMVLYTKISTVNLY